MKEKLGEMDQILPYLITHPYHAMVLVSLGIVILVMLYFAGRVIKALKTNFTQQNVKHQCECGQILPQINLLFKKQDKMCDTLIDIQKQISYLYGRFHKD